MTVSPFAPAIPARFADVPVTTPDPHPELWLAPLGTPVGAACDGSWNMLDPVLAAPLPPVLLHGEALDRDRNSTTSKSRGFDSPATPDSAAQAPAFPLSAPFWFEG